MIVHPQRDSDRLIQFEGCRRLVYTFGLVGTTLLDPENDQRFWTLEAFYTCTHPTRGIRASFRDQLGFVGFLDQRELEVLVGLAEPGEPCSWEPESYYPNPEQIDRRGPPETRWNGFHLTEEDENDALFEAELALLTETGDPSLLPGRVLTLKLHREHRHDWRATYECVCTRRDITMGIDDIRQRWLEINGESTRWETI